MGDIHQPLHVGFREDFGGTAIKLKEGKSLHEFWDNDLIAIHKGRSNWLAVADKYRSGFTEEHIARMRTSHDMKTVLSSSSEMIKYVAWLASDTAVTTTCKFGYRNENNEWIVNGETLSPKFIKDRIPVMIMALSKAAIRLAHLVDGIGIALVDGKKSAPALQSVRKESKLFGTKITADPTFNKFEILRLDLDDIEQPVENIGKTDETKGPAKKVEKIPKSSSRKKKGNNRKDKKKKDDDFEEVIAQFEAQKRKDTFEGIDLTNIKLMDCHGVDLITYLENSEIPDYQPTKVVTFRVAFDRNGSKEPKVYFFDGDGFDADMSAELAVRCILKVSGVKVDGETKIDRYWTPSNRGKSIAEKQSVIPAAINQEPLDESNMEDLIISLVRNDLNEKLTAHSRALQLERGAQIKTKFDIWKTSTINKASQSASINYMWKENIQEKGSKILNLTVSSVQAFVLEDTLTKPGYIMRFLVYNVMKSADELIRVLIDPEIFEGELNREILASLRQNSKKPITEIRPTWIAELRDVDLVLNGKDPNRMSHLRVIHEINLYESLYNFSHILEWVIKGAPRGAINPPGWDQAATTARVLASFMGEETAQLVNQFASLLGPRQLTVNQESVPTADQSLPATTKNMQNRSEK
jgi:hypothetical protein